jgi:hypothetical protein
MFINLLTLYFSFQILLFLEPTDEEFEEDIPDEERNFYKNKFAGAVMYTYSTFM